MILVYMIFLEMYGNGVQIYITAIIIQPFQIWLANNPKGPIKSYDPNDPFSSKRVMRGGSFLV